MQCLNAKLSQQMVLDHILQKGFNWGFFLHCLIFTNDIKGRAKRQQSLLFIVFIRHIQWLNRQRPKVQIIRLKSFLVFKFSRTFRINKIHYQPMKLRVNKLFIIMWYSQDRCKTHNLCNVVVKGEKNIEKKYTLGKLKKTEWN